MADRIARALERVNHWEKQPARSLTLRTDDGVKILTYANPGYVRALVSLADAVEESRDSGSSE